MPFIVSQSIDVIFPPIQNAAFSVEFHPSTSLPSLGGVSLLIHVDQPVTQAVGTAVGVIMTMPVDDLGLGVSVVVTCGVGVGDVGGGVEAER